MRMALCLSGQARRITTNYEVIKEYLLTPSNADVFFHFWDTTSEEDVYHQANVAHEHNHI